ncbi:xanthine dehydrogenase/oxidase-like [Clavelina lepadiformis]|uniref:xanthine dehydrogenase/oxidase-like n=1 Tax=Clavelina lepadiformis TaxID=159417 RepID=UPI0040436FBD
MSEEHIWNRPKDFLVFYVNGKKIIEHNADPEVSLLTYLRAKLRLTGTKLGCGEGGCGACTVMVSRWSRDEGRIIHISVNACLAPVVSMHECAVTTVEGIGSTKTKLHPVQERLADFHGSQCGFCTPGIVMSMYTLLRNKTVPTSHDIEMSLQGNLCRCTGYRPILSAFNTFTNKRSSKASGCPIGENCCKNLQNGCNMNGEFAVNGKEKCEVSDEKHIGQYAPYDPTQEPIFPPELLITSQQNAPKPLKFESERVTWYRPVTLDQLTDLKEKYPQAHLVVGNTEIGIEIWVKGQHHPVIVSPAYVDELATISTNEKGVIIGASCTLTQIYGKLEAIIKDRPTYETQPMQSVLDSLNWFAGNQIRNVAVLGGNVMTASPISDLNPILMACESEAKFMLYSRGERALKMDQHFFPSYRKTAAIPGEVLESITLPFTKTDEYMKFYMQSKRREDDIAIVNAAMRVKFYTGTSKVEKFISAFGGMAATSIMPSEMMKKMQDRDWDEALLEDGIKWLAEDLPLLLSAPGGMVEYREALAASFFFKFFVHVKESLIRDGLANSCLSTEEESTTDRLGGNHHNCLGTQTFEEVPEDQPADDPVGRPMKHISAEKQVTGEAIYLDDIPPYADELYLYLVTSTRAHAYIRGVNIDEAKTTPGFVTYVDYRDVPGSNNVGIDKQDQVFAKDKVTHVGHVIGAVVADNHAHAQRAARLVKVEYEDITPRIITIEEAIEHESYYKPTSKIKQGDVEKVMAICDHVISGECRIAGQEHFYLETQACLAVPKREDGEMEILASSQNPTALQLDAASALGVECNKIVVRVKRMGGGFGGKETRYNVLSNPVIVAANKCAKPVRCMLTRQEDMLLTGQRHAFLSKYKVGFNKEGKILALENDLYSNCGNSLDLSTAVMVRALFHSDNCYRIPNVSLRGFMCRTNLASNTAFRGFGGPQGLLIAEEWITRMAAVLNVSPEKVREINMYREGDVTHFGQKLENFLAGKCWHECLQRAMFDKRKAEIDIYNTNSRWRKRGISCIPTKFGISFYALHLNQAGALVHVYRDGSVLVTHGGTEMGQGLHTKMIQIASRCLGVPHSRIHLSETSTSTVPNTSPTAGSVSSDINGMAVQNACEIIKERLQPLQAKHPNLTWNKIIENAYFERISLSATGFYSTPDIFSDWNMETGKVGISKPFSYFTYGAAVSEVEVDCLTGDHIVLRTDIVMDLGRSLNPGIDIGQIEGAFTQGYGMMTLEEPLYSPKGEMLTRGPGTYKIPGFGDCPKEFNVHLLRGVSNDKAIFSSKAVGEPPLFLASSVFFAIKDAIGYAREDSGLSRQFRLDSPASAERIRMTCADRFTKQHKLHSKQEDPSNVTPWSVQA